MWRLLVDGKEVARWPYFARPPEGARRYCPMMGKNYDNPDRLTWFCAGDCELQRI